MVFASGYFDAGPSTKPHSGPTTIIEIKVQQIGQDRVSIIDVATNMTIVKLPPGQEGLVGNAIRGLQRIRRQEKLSISDRYQLVEWKDNRITLSDMDLDRHIPLSSFSPPRASAAAKLQQYLLDKRALD